jgi:hypothetical protein
MILKSHDADHQQAPGLDPAHVAAAPTANMVTPDMVTATLRQLGTTREQVAQTLWAGGHRGRPECETTCPVARWLDGRFPGYAIEVIEHGGWLWAEITAPGQTVTVRLPNAVAAFVVTFDSGGFAEFDARSDPAAVAA